MIRLKKGDIIMNYAKIGAFCTLGLFLLCNLALAWPLTGTLQEWSFEDLRPHDIAFTEDGTAWLVHDVSPVGKVFSFDPSTGSVGAQVTASENAHFWKIARAPDGKMWITDDEQHRLYYFDPNVDPEDITLEKVDLPPDFGTEPKPWGVAVAPDGKVWFTCTGKPGVEDTPSSVGYYDPIAEDWKTFLIPETESCEDGLKNIGTPKDIAVSSTGMVSFTLNSLIKGAVPNGTPGMGQVVYWQAEPTLIICPEAFDPIKLDHPHGVALDPTDFYGIWFIDQGYINNAPPVEDMVGQVIRFRSLTSPDRSFTSIAFPTPPEFLHWDAHFLAVDPSHQYIWATSYSNNALLIIERPTSRFSSLHFDHIKAPMGIRLFGGEVWFTATGILDPGTTGVGRFTVLPDSDDDGIPDEIDTDPDNYSNGFNDGIMVGEILTRGDQDLALIRHIAHDGKVGVIAMADRSGVGGLPAFISPYENCPETPEPAIVEVDGNISALFTCSTPSLKALLGPVKVMLPDGIVVQVPTRAKVSFAEISEGTLNIQNSGNQGTISIEYQGKVTELNVGESTLVKTDIDKDGVFGGDDKCPDTPFGEIVDADGCRIDQLCPCEKDPPWKNNGEYVSCVAKTAESFVEQGLITETNKDMIVSEAANSDCGKKK